MTDTDQTNSGETPPNGDQEREELTVQAAEDQERKVLMGRARMMGISISNNIGLETLRQRIKDAQEGAKEKPAVEVPETPVAPLVDPKEKKQRVITQRDKLRRDAMKLIRCHIVNLNPNKKDLNGEIFTVGNRRLGMVRKFVAYGEVTENGYHIPNIIYKMLLERKYLQIRTRKGPRGTPIVESNWVKEFAITVLPPLTKEELHDLAVAQAAAGSVG